MNRPHRLWSCVAGVVLLASAELWAQAPAPAVAPVPATAPAPARVVAPAASAAPVVKQGQLPPAPGPQYRQLAPGVVNTVDQEWSSEEASSRHDVIELTAFDPSFDFAKDVPYRHEVWCLEFSFKTPRMVWIDVPQEDGRMRRQLIWYMVYSVRNPGKWMVPTNDVDLPYKTADGKKVWQIQRMDRPVRFVPQFLLEGHDSVSGGEGFTKVYPDRVIPIAMRPIQMREDPRRVFCNSVDMCRQIAVGETVWGVATWENLDPLIDRFSIYVKGLTNAYKWEDQQGAYTQGAALGTGRRLACKTLKLNFWRPSDEYYEHEGEIRYGFPGDVDYQWVYR
jgi:hypothetical protein